MKYICINLVKICLLKTLLLNDNYLLDIIICASNPIKCLKYNIQNELEKEQVKTN